MRRFALLLIILFFAGAALPCDTWWEYCRPADGWDTGCTSFAHAILMTQGDDCVGWVSGIGHTCIKAGSPTCWEESPYFCGPDVPYTSDPNSVVQADRDHDHDLDIADVAWWQDFYQGIHWVVWDEDHWVEVE